MPKDKPTWGGRRTNQTGRPPGRSYPKQIAVRLSAEQIARLERYAAERGCTIAEALRLLIDALPE
jgi:hypothetical protein